MLDKQEDTAFGAKYVSTLLKSKKEKKKDFSELYLLQSSNYPFTSQLLTIQLKPSRGAWVMKWRTLAHHQFGLSSILRRVFTVFFPPQN